jgi:hypothetical protein
MPALQLFCRLQFIIVMIEICCFNAKLFVCIIYTGTVTTIVHTKAKRLDVVSSIGPSIHFLRSPLLHCQRKLL